MTANKTHSHLGVMQLESREVPSVAWIGMSGSTLVVSTDNAATSVTINANGSYVRVVEGGSNRTWDYASVASVAAYGGGGADRFVNNVYSLPVTLYGYGGNDYLEGYNGADVMVGGEGDDTLVGYGGVDQMWGGNGQDRIQGMDGTDYLYGEDGHDTVAGGNGTDYLYGGYGNDAVVGGNDKDYLYGGEGDDSLVSIDGGTTDAADGQGGADSIWQDRNSGGSWPWSPTYYDTGYAERVSNVPGFANGADRTLDGDYLADPTDGTFYKSFRDKPLFGVGGPSMDDVVQNDSNDCWLMAPAAAMARDNPTAVRHMVADFGDGTYGVQLGGNFYRVDGDLPTWNSTSTSPRFAGLGLGGALWVPVVEKAYAHYRTGANTYASLDWGYAVSALMAYSHSSVGSAGFDPSSNPAGVCNAVFSHWNARQSCTICTGASMPAGSPLAARHCYTVVAVWRNTAGTVTNIQVRNPWGGSGAYIMLTPAQLAACSITVAWGTS